MRKETYVDAIEVASRAAKDAIATLARVVAKNGEASWVLAGGTSPMAAYAEIVSTYADAIDWSKVTILIGDERCVPLNHKDSNWGQISKILLAHELITGACQITPRTELGAEEGARAYSQQIRHSSAYRNGKVRIDLLWLGVGEDGHTLSLFPEHPALKNNRDIVIPVHNSPKPPSDRFTLSLGSAVMAKKIVIFATGHSKKDALVQVENYPRSFPVGLIAEKADALGAEVLWLYDKAASA